jgi:hypothetical protein
MHAGSRCGRVSSTFPGWLSLSAINLGPNAYFTISASILSTIATYLLYSLGSRKRRMHRYYLGSLGCPPMSSESALKTHAIVM